MGASRRIRRWRRLVQVAVFTGMFIVPLLNILEVHVIKGTFYSLDIGSISMADPLAIAQAMLGGQFITTAMIASIAVPVLLAMLLGRIWCSWMCPYHLLVEWLHGLRRLISPHARPPEYDPARPARSNRVRFITLIVGMALVGVASVPILNLVSAPGVLSSQALVLVKFHGLTFEIVFILAILAVEWFLMSHFWCRLFCPTGTGLSLFRFRHTMHVARNAASCTDCGVCASVCPMLLDPRTEGSDPLCHNCGECIDGCPENARRSTLACKIH